MKKKTKPLNPTFKLWLGSEAGYVIGKGGVTLLKAIMKYGSITEAAKKIGISYKHAWDMISEMEKAFGEPFLQTRVGGRMGGGAELTESALTLIRNYDRVERYIGRVLNDKEYWEVIGLKISARNRLKGIVEDVQVGPVTSKVKVRITTPTTITAVITKEAVDELQIKPGEKVEAVIKATEVMIAKE
ncbi:MAG: molybdenum-dependent transcriptional regulator [Candidatus Bathyarchaeia archaeon]|nr:molybdenum-dependent transcriptional regulator [Candidatus Bathyarchaeota archaeon]